MRYIEKGVTEIYISLKMEQLVKARAQIFGNDYVSSREQKTEVPRVLMLESPSIIGERAYIYIYIYMHDSVYVNVALQI